MTELVGAGKTPAELSREFGCSAQTISNWVAQAAVDRGKPLPGKDGLTSAEREELTRLRREEASVMDNAALLSKFWHEVAKLIPDWDRVRAVVRARS